MDKAIVEDEIRKFIFKMSTLQEQCDDEQRLILIDALEKFIKSAREVLSEP